MREPHCGCCHTTLWTEYEIASSVCDECMRIGLHPERYRNCADIDALLVSRRVRSLLHANKRRIAAVA